MFFTKKCIAVVLFLICAIATVSAYEGRVGGEIEYTRYLNSDITEVESWGGVFSLTGASYFDCNSIFGLKYSFGYVYNTGALKQFDVYDFQTLALFNVDLSEISEIELGIGFFDDLFVFNDLVSNQFGTAFSVSLIFKPIQQMAINLGVDYLMPLLASYGNTMKDIALDNHVFRYGLSVSYIY